MISVTAGNMGSSSNDRPPSPWTGLETHTKDCTIFILHSNKLTGKYAHHPICWHCPQCEKKKKKKTNTQAKPLCTFTG